MALFQNIKYLISSECAIGCHFEAVPYLKVLKKNPNNFMSVVSFINKRKQVNIMFSVTSPKGVMEVLQMKQYQLLTYMTFVKPNILWF